jgi:hypothetical protein
VSEVGGEIDGPWRSSIFDPLFLARCVHCAHEWKFNDMFQAFAGVENPQMSTQDGWTRVVEVLACPVCQHRVVDVKLTVDVR